MKFPCLHHEGIRGVKAQLLLFLSSATDGDEELTSLNFSTGKGPGATEYELVELHSRSASSGDAKNFFPPSGPRTPESPPRTLVNIPLTLSRHRTHITTFGQKEKTAQKLLFGQSTWNCWLQLVTACGLLLSRSNVTSVNTPRHSKTDFATKDSFYCKYFILKPRERERDTNSRQYVANLFVSGFYMLQNMALLTFRAHASSKEFFALSIAGYLIIGPLVLLISPECEKTPLDFHPL